MPRVIVTIDDTVIKEVDLVKERTTLGRRPYNDIVIENLVVSGEHLGLIMQGGQVVVEDLNSTNGTYVNGIVVKRQVLQHDDIIEVGKYKIRFLSDTNADFEKTMVFKSRPVASAVPPTPSSDMRGTIKVLSGAAAGREMPLTKIVTTVGKPGLAVAAITRRPHNFFVHHVEGVEQPLLNGIPVGEEPAVLKDGDRIVLAGIQMQFVQT